MTGCVRINRNAIVSASAFVIVLATIARIALFAPSDEGAVIGPGFLVVAALVASLVFGIRGLKQIDATGERGKTLALIGISGPVLYIGFVALLGLFGR